VKYSRFFCSPNEFLNVNVFEKFQGENTISVPVGWPYF
jgi:hypothetical protein